LTVLNVDVCNLFYNTEYIYEYFFSGYLLLVSVQKSFNYTGGYSMQ